MFLNKEEEIVIASNGAAFRAETLLADVNIPYKFCIDKVRNKLFFCINADDFSDQSFQSVVLDLETKQPCIVPSIRNGFACAVDPDSGATYLGGSEGIFLYSYLTQDIEQPALVSHIDIFDLFFDKNLYFVDTATQTVHLYKGNDYGPIRDFNHHLIAHFLIDGDGDAIFVTGEGLFSTEKGHCHAVSFYEQSASINIRGGATDLQGEAHVIASDGIYAIDKKRHQIFKILSIDKGYSMAFDRYNHIVYSNERSIYKLVPCDND